MATLLILLKLFPAILAVVQSVEAAIPLPSTGKAKLDLVLGTVSDIYTSTQTGQELPLEKLSVLVSQTVTRVVATLNSLGIFKKSA